MELPVDSKWMDIAFKILSLLIIPILGWGIRLEVTNAVQTEKIERLEEELKASDDLKKSLDSNAQAIIRVEEKLDATNKRLDDIKGDLRRSLPPD